MRSSLEPFPVLAAFLAGSPCRWSDLEIDAPSLLEIAGAEDLSALIVHRLFRAAADDWPPRVRDELAAAARARAGEELARAAETRAVLAALAGAGVRALLIKGAALAYTLYDTPAARPRADTDLLIEESDVPAARRVLSELGYEAPDYCAGLFAQFEMEKVDARGVTHVFDVHWRISTQPMFQHLLSYAEALARARPAPVLGAHAIVLNPVDALLLACVHPVMHHRNQEPVLWMYDIHLLVEHLSRSEADEFVEIARARRVAEICRHQLGRARTVFGTRAAAHALARLETVGGDEPSASYLASERRWHDELVSSIRGLPTVGERTRLLRDVLLPSHDYMLGTYGLRGKRFAALLLPALYVHRNLRGAWRIVTGKK
jgi:hypothetical protein